MLSIHLAKLRSSAMPWGIKALTKRELNQVFTGSRLFLNSLFLELATYFGGGIAEHPAAPSFASIWRTPIHTISYQCDYGHGVGR